eukprot:1177266-Prorocentrum_minimum.AAC.3
MPFVGSAKRLVSATGVVPFESACFHPARITIDHHDTSSFALSASDWSVMRIYLRFLRLIGPLLFVCDAPAANSQPHRTQKEASESCIGTGRKPPPTRLTQACKASMAPSPAVKINKSGQLGWPPGKSCSVAACGSLGSSRYARGPIT